MTIGSELAPFVERVKEAEMGNVTALALHSPVERVISFEGSFLTFPDFAAEEEIQQQLAMALLDKGTRRRDRFELAEALDDRGARLSFSADGLSCSFAGRCLTDDFPAVMDLLAEQLREPLFDEGEFEKARTQQTAAIRRIMDETGSQAHAALARRLYEPSSPNHRPRAEDDLAHLDGLSVKDVVEFYEGHVGARDARIVAVGDLDETEIFETIRRALGDWQEPGKAATFAPGARPSAPGRESLAISDRPNLDVRIGQPVAVRRGSDDYLPLFVAVHVLGGNFSARLMSTVRDEQGLTYGIGSRLAGVSIHHDCYFLTSVTLSQDRLEQGIEATLEQIRQFAEGGITPEELEEKKTTIAGSYKVGLATTRGLASSLLANAERGFDVGYLDRFPRLVHELTVEEVNTAIRRHVDPSSLHVAVAGTLPNRG